MSSFFGAPTNADYEKDSHYFSFSQITTNQTANHLQPWRRNARNVDTIQIHLRELMRTGSTIIVEYAAHAMSRYFVVYCATIRLWNQQKLVIARMLISVVT